MSVRVRHFWNPTQRLTVWKGMEHMDVDASVWTSIGLGNVLKGINDRVWDAIRNDGKDVGVMIDGVLVAAFTRVDDRIVAVIDGKEIARYQS